MSRPGWSTVVIVALAASAITWLVALAVLGGSDTTTVKVVGRRGERAEPAAPGATADDGAARIAELEREVAALKAARAAKPRAAQPAPGAKPTAEPQATEPAGDRIVSIGPGVITWGKPVPATRISADDARHAAERFAAAVRAGNDGSAWLPLALAGPADRPDAWAPLEGVVRDTNVAAGARAATLDALAEAGRDVAKTAEDVLATSQEPELRGAALRAILAAVRGGAPIPPVVRTILTDTAADAGERDMALTIVAVSDPATALPILEALVLSAAPEERERGFNILVAQRHKAYLPLMIRVSQRDDLGDRVPAITEAIALTKDRKWSALQMTGEPDTPAAGDYGTAWAAKGEEMGAVTIELTFERAVRAEAVRIRETLCAGGVASVEIESGSGWEMLWSGTADPGDAPRWFEPSFARSAASGRKLRIVVETDRVKGWEEIDAVELIGGGTRQWASGATATSSYAD